MVPREDLVLLYCGLSWVDAVSRARSKVFALASIVLSTSSSDT